MVRAFRLASVFSRIEWKKLDGDGVTYARIEATGEVQFNVEVRAHVRKPRTCMFLKLFRAIAQLLCVQDYRCQTLGMQKLVANICIISGSSKEYHSITVLQAFAPVDLTAFRSHSSI